MKKYLVKIKRQDTRDSIPYYQVFNYLGEESDTISFLIDKINSQDVIIDIDNNVCKPIMWECSCIQGLCGACSMVVNDTPCLACKTKLSSFDSLNIDIEPLSKFEVIKDLVVDKTILHNLPIENEIYRDDSIKYNKQNHQTQYESAKCLKCGLCIEICPNTSLKHNFLGLQFANDCYLEASQTEKKEYRNKILKTYEKKVAQYCSKSFACQKVCPVNIDVRKLFSDMNGNKL